MTDANFELLALSPLDGRYAADVSPLANYYSEFAFLRDRVRIELDYLRALAEDARLTRPLTSAETQCLQRIAAEFSPADAQAIQAHERVTRHDVKAIEYFLRDRFAGTSLEDLTPWLHFGLTSEDVNQTALALALRDARDAVLLPALDALAARLQSMALDYSALPMLARTHGQPAVPTTLGKELAVFWSRLDSQIEILREHQFAAKLNGAVGNFNAHAAAAPQVDWLSFSECFIRRLGLEPQRLTTQLMPYDNWVRYFDGLRLTNTILLDLAQDLWRYISDDYLKLRTDAAQVGSSTMPQKVNPIDFENAEGNLGIANALFDHYARKLPVSRLQRDLSDSTVRRTFGVALGHSLLAYRNLSRGLEKIEPNQSNLRADLDAHWETLAEAAQTILRAAGEPDAYEQLKQLTRGKPFTREIYLQWVDGLSVAPETKTRLTALTPFDYIGLAKELVDNTVGDKQ